jgi:hypothetical protein
MLPAYKFQLMAGIYLVQIVVIMSVLLNGIVNGHDRVEEEDLLGKNLIYATLIYAGLTIAVVLVFAGLVSGITEMM